MTRSGTVRDHRVRNSPRSWLAQDAVIGVGRPLFDDAPVKMKDGTRLHVESEGNDDPRSTLIFVHGWAGSLRAWDEQRSALQNRGVRRVFYDHRGFGKSTPWSGGPVSVRQLGADLSELVDAAPSSAPVILVGHSMGTLAIISLAAQRPELFERGRVPGLVLIGSPGCARYIHLGLPQPAVPLLHRALPPIASRVASWRADRPLALPDWAFSLAHGRHSSPGMRRSLSEQMASNRSDTLAAYLGACLSFDESAFDTLSRARVQIIHGTSDHLAAIKGARGLARRIPGSTFHELRRCGHMAQVERAAEVNRIIGSLQSKIATTARLHP